MCARRRCCALLRTCRLTARDGIRPTRQKPCGFARRPLCGGAPGHAASAPSAEMGLACAHESSEVFSIVCTTQVARRTGRRACSAGDRGAAHSMAAATADAPSHPVSSAAPDGFPVDPATTDHAEAAADMTPPLRHRYHHVSYEQLLGSNTLMQAFLILSILISEYLIYHSSSTRLLLLGLCSS